MADDCGPFDENSEKPEVSPRVNLVAEIAASFTYASHQNAIPVIRSIRIENCATEYLNNVKVELASTPAFLRPLRAVERTAESSGEFVWKAGTLTEFLPFRPPATPEAQRPIADIPLAELASIVMASPGLLDEPDAARALASVIDVERLAATSRSRLEEALARARPHVASASTRV